MFRKNIFSIFFVDKKDLELIKNEESALEPPSEGISLPVIVSDTVKPYLMHLKTLN